MSNIMANRNIVEVAFSKIQDAKKTDLESQKVELADYDFQKYMKDYDKSFTDYRGNYRKGINLAKSSTDKHFKDVFDILSKAEREMDEFGNKAKELGFDFRDSKNWQTFQQLKKILLSRKSDIKTKQKEISKLM